MDSDEKYIAKKPKLPRKRKKAAIKAQGRDWYRKTILLYKTTQKNGRFYEPVCKFWVNAAVRYVPYGRQDGKLLVTPTPTRYW